MKLVLDEPESAALRGYLEGGAIVSSELLLVEVQRAIHRAAGSGPLQRLLQLSEALLDNTHLLPLDAELLRLAAALPEPALRSLDAIHVASALTIDPLDAFVTYDERQAAVARLCGLQTAAPSA